MLKKLIIPMATALLPLGAKAIIAPPEPVEISQPDGTILTVIISGDEFHHITRTTDGYLLVENEDGFYHYADSTPEGKIRATNVIAREIDLRSPEDKQALKLINKNLLTEIATEERKEKIKHRQERKISSPLDSTSAPYLKPFTCSARSQEESIPEPGIGLCDKAFPAYGDQKALVILVEYQDVKFTVNDPRDFYTRMLNEEDFDLYGATGSARDYFFFNSNGIFRPQFDVYGPILLKGDRRAYGGNDYYGDDCNPQGMVIESLQQLDPKVDFSQYDRDGDGFIDNVFVFYAGGGEHDGGGGSNSVWPHAANITSWIATPYIFDGVRLDSYGCTCERQKAYDRPDGIGTFVHEFSHVMGLPDLYTTDYNSAYTPGSVSPLDTGPYNNQGKTPPNYSSFERIALGWMEPKEFGQDGWYTIPELSETNTAYIIKSCVPEEYYLLENRQKKGNDKYLPLHGMVIWHILYDHDIWEANKVNNDPNFQRVDLIEADNRENPSTRMGQAYPGLFSNTSFGYDSSPALFFEHGPITNIQLSFIEEVKGVIGFAYTTDRSGGAGINKVPDETHLPYSLVDLNIEAKERIEIFNSSGEKTGQLKSGETLTLPQNGLYFIKTSTETFKVMI